MCTPGQFTEVLFKTVEVFRVCMNAIAICAVAAGIEILTFEVMSNHLHFILAGPEERCTWFFSLLKKRLKRFFSQSGRFVDLNRFEIELIPINDLQACRIEIVYVNRNGYLVNPNHTPFSYPWGAGNLYFMPPFPEDACTKWGDLTSREKERVAKSRVPDIPDGFLIRDGLILPQNYCAVEKGMSLFKDAHHYFSMVSKNYEAFSEVAKRLGDKVMLTDEEAYAALRQFSSRRFGDEKITMLPVQDKLELARHMKLKYNATDAQMQRMLRLDRSVIAELFGRVGPER